MSAWIKMISDEEAGKELRKVLDMVRTPHDTVDNVMRIHSLRPSTMRGHFTLYKSCLHDEANTLPKWFQEVISSYVSILNNCDYSLANHWLNAKHLIKDEKKIEKIECALFSKVPEIFFKGRDLAILKYAEKLTLKPGSLEKSDVEALKAAGLKDGEILEANQIICYFNYVNRTINGLGVSTSGDKVGYYS